MSPNSSRFSGTRQSPRSTRSSTSRWRRSVPVIAHPAGEPRCRPIDRAQHGGLAGAVRADHGDDLPGLQRQRHAAHRLDAAIGHARHPRCDSSGIRRRRRDRLPARSGSVAHRGRLALADLGAEIHHHDAVDQAHDELHVVLDQQDRQALRAQRAQQRRPAPASPAAAARPPARPAPAAPGRRPARGRSPAARWLPSGRLPASAYGPVAPARPARAGAWPRRAPARSSCRSQRQRAGQQAGPRPRIAHRAARCRAALIRGRSLTCWKVRAMPARAMARCGSRVMSRPANTMRPRLARSAPVIRLNIVLLPAPFGPISAEDLAGAHVEADVVDGDQAAEPALRRASTCSSSSPGARLRRAAAAARPAPAPGAAPAAACRQAKGTTPSRARCRNRMNSAEKATICQLRRRRRGDQRETSPARAFFSSVTSAAPTTAPSRWPEPPIIAIIRYSMPGSTLNGDRADEAAEMRVEPARQRRRAAPRSRTAAAGCGTRRCRGSRPAMLPPRSTRIARPARERSRLPASSMASSTHRPDQVEHAGACSTKPSGPSAIGGMPSDAVVVAEPVDIAEQVARSPDPRRSC